MFGDYTEFESALKAEINGQFGFNPNNNSWHGGVHFTHNNAAHLKDDMPVVAIADGKVVACRINDKYQTSTFKGETLTYSHDFCLIQHDVVNPDNNSERFTFYSLYMHLAPLGYPHRQVTQRPQKKVFKKYQTYSEPNVDGETFALLPGSIVESQSDTLEHHGDHYFQSYRIARADDLALQDKTIWLVTHQDITPPDVSHQFLEQTLFTPNTYNTASVECLGLKRELRIRYSPSMDAPYFSLRQNSKVKLLNDEPVRDGDFILKAYEIVYNSNASVKEVRQGDKVWMPVAKYAEKQAINQEGMEAYSPPDWVLTKVVAKTIREGLAGRAEPYLKNGVLQAGNVAYRIPEGTVLGYKRSENCNVQMINGKSHLMALCRVSSDSPVINASGQKMTSAWVCVEDEFVEKQTVYSLDLGKTHCFGNSSSLHVKAGEAIGYLGRYDAATIGEEPPYTTRHQIHFELFSTEKPPQFFIDLFFGVSEEQPEITFIEDTSNCDGYFDRDEPSGFFQQFNDDPQEGGDPVTSILKRLKPWDGGKSIIAKHESEWSLASSEKPFFDKLIQKYQDPDFAELIEHEKTRLDDLIWLPDVGSLGITKDTWNWWPIHGANIVSSQTFDLGFSVAKQTQALDVFWNEYFSDETSLTTIDLIKKHNEHLNNPIRMGEIIIVLNADPVTEAETQRLSQLKEEATESSQALGQLHNDEVVTVNRYFEMLEYYLTQVGDVIYNGRPTDNYAYASTGVGAVSAAVITNLEHIENILMDINSLYVTQVAATSQAAGWASRNAFFDERAKLFKKLDHALSKLTLKTVNIPIFNKMKNTLKLSTKSVIHNADEIIKGGVVPNLGKRIAKIAMASKGMQNIGHIGLILGGASAATYIYDACKVNGSGQCGETVAIEVGGFAGGWIGSSYGGVGGVKIALALGVAASLSAPVVIGVVVIGGVTGAVGGGIVGAGGGKFFGEVLYERLIDPIMSWWDE